MLWACVNINENIIIIQYIIIIIIIVVNINALFLMSFTHSLSHVRYYIIHCTFAPLLFYANN